MHRRISIIVIFCLCTNLMFVFSSASLKKTNDFQISPEELLQRRKILDAHLSLSAEAQKNWVETYSVHFGSKENKDSSETIPAYPEHPDTKDETETPSVLIETKNTYNELPELEIDQENNHLSKKEKAYSFSLMSSDSKEMQDILDSGKKIPVPKKSVSDVNAKSQFNNKEDIIENNTGQVNVSEKTSIDLPEGNVTENSTYQINDIENKLNGSSKVNVTEQINDIEKNQNNSTKENVDGIITKEINEDGEILKKLPIHEKSVVTNQVVLKDTLNDDSEEMQRRQNILNSYLSEFGAESKNLVETYSFILKPNDHTESSTQEAPLVSTPEQNDLKWMFENKMIRSPIPDCARERIYFNRWIMKLQNKIKNTKYSSISLSFSSESVDRLKDLFSSESFDIVSIDEFFNGLISNATINDGYRLLEYIPSFKLLCYATTIAIFAFAIYTLRQNPFFLFLFFFILIILFSIFMHGYKMYLTKIAEKHHTLSSISSSHCVNTLTAKSGIYDHIYEFFRHMYHHEDCKKYYETVMVDTVCEMNLLVIIADFISTIFLQCFKVLAHTLNYCVKVALYGTTWTQSIFILIIFMFLMLIYFNYKIKLPFVRIEPTFIPAGSRAEDLTFRKRNFLEYFIPGNFYKPALDASNDIDEIGTNKVGSLKKICDHKDSLSICSTNVQCINKEQICCVSCHMNEINPSGLVKHVYDDKEKTSSVSCANMKCIHKEQIHCESCNIIKMNPVTKTNQGQQIYTTEGIKKEITPLLGESNRCSNYSYQLSISDTIKKENCYDETSLIEGLSENCGNTDFASYTEIDESVSNDSLKKRIERLTLEADALKVLASRLLSTGKDSCDSKSSAVEEISENCGYADFASCTELDDDISNEN